MELKERLERAIAQWDLLEHPFYQAWRAGELPLEALKEYASEYGAFIGMLPNGWAAVGDQETAQEERDHARLWDSFASSIETSVREPALPETIALLDGFESRLRDHGRALGALYAFEAQQPNTTATKLEGLRLHYDVAAAGETYFESHADDDHEAEWLLEQLSGLSEAEQDQAVEACEATAHDLWDALSGVTPQEVRTTAM